MLPVPLHPAIVHFPIVFAVLLPLAAVAALVVARRGVSARPAWAAVVVLAGLLTASSWAAVRTGEAQEDRVERVLPEEVLHTHEEAGERFLWLTLVTLAAVGVGLLPGRPGAVGRTAGTVLAVAVLVAGYRVGASGGELVYEHGAASAYASGATATPGLPSYDDGTAIEDDSR